MSASTQRRANDRPEWAERLSNNLRGLSNESEIGRCALDRLPATYILPIRREAPIPDAELRELTDYLELLARHLDVIVVDGSPDAVFDRHHDAWRNLTRHIRPHLTTLNGKVGNVITGVREARHDRLVIADDDVRYSAADLARVIRELDRAEVVRPQNYFDPLPWHARWDTARSLLNRVTGGDWPGTLAVRRSILLATNGYDGEVLFENLELVRTVKAAGGREAVLLDVFVRRLPPDASHFWSQRTRQAYDELARPARLLIWLCALPALLTLLFRRKWVAVALSTAGLIGVAEAGRQRAGAVRVFPWSSSLFAPAWLIERSVCSWIAVAMRVIRGGVPYHGRVLRRAATPVRELRRRHRAARTLHCVGGFTTSSKEAPGRVNQHVV
jgi:hypothetical protein